MTMLVKITSPKFESVIDYPNKFDQSTDFMSRWNLDQILKFCQSRDWTVKITSSNWKWETRR